MAELTLLITFIAGLLSFSSPCVIPLVPGFLAYLAGTSLSESRFKRKGILINQAFAFSLFESINASYTWYNFVYDMLTDRMRVGPKGQVVIPRSFRKVLKIGPGSEVVFRLEGDRVVLETETADPLQTFESISRKGRSVSRISPHEYERELEERTA